MVGVVPFGRAFWTERWRRRTAAKRTVDLRLRRTTGVPLMAVVDALLMESVRRRTVRMLPLPVRVMLRFVAMVMIPVQIQAIVPVVGSVRSSRVH